MFVVRPSSKEDQVRKDSNDSSTDDDAASSCTYSRGMAPLRDIDPTGMYHAMSRGNYRHTIFRDRAHYEKYLELVDRVARRRGWIVLDESPILCSFGLS